MLHSLCRTRSKVAEPARSPQRGMPLERCVGLPPPWQWETPPHVLSINDGLDHEKPPLTPTPTAPRRGLRPTQFRRSERDTYLLACKTFCAPPPRCPDPSQIPWESGVGGAPGLLDYRSHNPWLGSMGVAVVQGACRAI